MSKVGYELEFSGIDWGDSRQPRISMFPRDRHWNDFGFNFLASMNVAPSDGREVLKLDVYAMPLDQSSNPVRFTDWFDSRWREVKKPFQQRKSGFFTLFGSDDMYRKLFRWCKSRAEFEEILFVVNELTWCRVNKTADPAVIKRLVQSEAFRLGVLRTGGAYRAFRSGYEYGARHQVELDDGRIPFQVSVTLSGFPSSHQLRVGYVETPLLEDRVHCVVGPNGVGKSRFLRGLILVLARAHEVGGSPFRDVSSAEYASVSEVGQQSLPTFSRVIAYSTEVGSQLPRLAEAESSFDYQYFSLVDSSGLEARHDNSGIKLSRMIIDLLRGQDEDGDFNRLGALRAAVSPHLDWKSIAIPLMGLDPAPSSFVDEVGSHWIRFSVLGSLNEERRLHVSADFDSRREIGFFDENRSRISISSGQRTFLRFALHFLSFSSRGSLIIVDEPETHLHPNLVSAFSVLLYQVLSHTKSVAIVATHSAYVVREVPSHCVHVFRRDGSGAVVTDKIYMRTLGASPTSISLAVFGDDSSKKFYDELVRRVSESGLGIDQVLKEYGGLMSPDMLMQVREMLADPTDQEREP